MATFLFFPYSNQLGSTVPSITLAKMLQEKGHRVVYASKGKYTNVLIEKGFEVIPINEISYLQYRTHVDENNVDFYTESLITHLVEKELEIIEEINPDIIVTNNRPTIKIAAQLANKKLVTIVIPTLCKYYNHRYYVPENHFLNKILPVSDINTIMPKSIVKYAFSKTMQQWGKNFNKVLKKYKLPLFKNFLDVYEGDITLINQTKGLSPFNNLSSNYFHLQQNLESTFGGEPHPWIHEIEEHKQAGRKIIFVSMGSSSLKSYPLVIDAVKKLVEANDEYVLISNHVGLKNNIQSTKRIYVEKFINSSQVLPLCNLVVTHGGINTLSECILNKKVIIGIPEQGEQMWNLKYAEYKGFGKMLSKEKLEKDASLLSKTIVEVIHNVSYQINLDDFAKELNENSTEKNNEEIYNAIMKMI
jgi:UDP:flavonoid glycosyltransferase YjiC (YdhE family)